MVKQIYAETQGTYLQNNPEWHTEDSAWKATQILKMLGRNQLEPESVVEIGCGAGEILKQLQERMRNKSVRFYGYEVAPDAYEMCQSRANEKLEFFHKDLLEEEGAYFDLLLMIDVFEHVENYFDFIRKSGRKAKYKIFHIPLDISVSSVLRNRLMHTRKKVGHINYFTKDTALASLEDAGQQVLDYFYTHGAAYNNKQLRTKMLNIPRNLVYSANPDTAATLFGGYSLLVLTK